MGIPHLKIGNNQPKKIKVVEEIQAPRDSTFTALVPDTKVTQLLKHIEGHKWPVRYYGSLINSQSPVNQYDKFEVDLSKSYVEIMNCQLRVSSPLDNDYDDSTAITRLTGTATLPYHITPNAGDFFIAAVDNGEDALFIVNRVVRPTHRKETVYTLDYFLYGYLNDDLTLKESIPKRVNETYYFDDFIDSRNRNVLLTTQQRNTAVELRSFLHASKQFYFDVLRQEDTGTFSIPDQHEAIIDPLLINFIKKTVDLSKHYMGAGGDYHFPSNDYKLRSIWDVILTKNYLNTNFCRDWGFISTGSFANRGILSSPSFLFIDYVLHPLNPDRSRRSDDVFVQTTGIYERVVTNDNYYMNPNLITNAKLPTGDVTMKLLPELFTSGYLVTEHFYTLLETGMSSTDISKIEVLLCNLIKVGQLDPKELLDFASTWVNWSPLHQLYYLPVIWYLIKLTLGIV